MQSWLLYSASVVVMLWGIGHLVPTRDIVRGFGELAPDNRRILLMEWIAEGLTLIFLGLLVLLITATAGPDNAVAQLVIRACAGMLLLMAMVSAFTGARTAILPIRLCPFIKTAVAAAFLVATFV